MQPHYEFLRKKLLACLYAQDFVHAQVLMEQIVTTAVNQSFQSEADQKALNQILHSTRRFGEAIRRHCGPEMSMLIRKLRRKMVAVVRDQTRQVVYVGYDEWRNGLGLSSQAFEILLKTTACLQLTVGCGNFCRRCNEWALPGVRKHFTLDAAQKIIRGIFEAGNDQVVLYSASDPLDWRHGNDDISAILEFMASNGYRQRYGLLTKVPRGAEKRMRRLIDMNADLAVSVTSQNRARVKAIERQTQCQMAVQHDCDELVIPAGLDEDLTSVKSSITDNYGIEITPEGAFQIIPTFTSALHLTGQARLPVSALTEFFLPIKTGRSALRIEYFKPFKAMDTQGREFFLKVLLKPQLENLLLDNGSDTVTPPRHDEPA